MIDNPTVIVDRVRAEGFALLGSVPARRLFQGYETWTDGEEVVWAGKRVGEHGVAVTWLGQGWVYDPSAAQKRCAMLAVLRAEMKEADATTHALKLASVLGQLRLGEQCERLLWLIHQRVIACRKSAFHLPDYMLANAVWGKDRTPHWRSDLLRILTSLSWLHLTDWPGEGFPILGQTTALLTHVADLRNKPADQCGPDCPGYIGHRHHHFLINVGRGFLGVLEQFGQEDENSGVRTYDFPTGERTTEGPTLWKVGRSGRIVSAFLPAKLGDPAACSGFTRQQHRLLQTIVRETTRASRKTRSVIGPAEVFTGNTVKALDGKKRVACPLLSQAGEYVGFNGNRKFKEKGYKFASKVGWLVKAGYPLDAVESFLGDLAVLAGPLGLVVVGIGRGLQFFSLQEMQALSMTRQGKRALDRLHIRIYTAPGYLERWSMFFGGEAPFAKRPSCDPLADAVAALLADMKASKISRRKLAAGIKQDPSFFSRVLNGKKPWPKGLLEKAKEWVGARTCSKPSKPRTARRPSEQNSGTEEPLLDEALRLLEQGWSVVPQRPGMKQPCVRWKPYQDRLPTEEEMASWFEEWPDAGLALVLGPVSGIFVIDVDGEEAHAALLERLGKEPLAPKALSGSGKPCRYHLYFQCPGLPTRAKQTPWHPKLEFRGKGGIVITPPSLHKSGKRYAWAKGRSPAEMELPPLPTQVLEALKPLVPVRKAGGGPALKIKPVTGVDASQRTLEFLSGKWAEGPRWNDKLFCAACDLCGREMPLEEAEPLLLAGAKPWTVGDAELARNTIASAYSQPREPARL